MLITLSPVRMTLSAITLHFGTTGPFYGVVRSGPSTTDPPADLTGWQIEAFDVSEGLAGKVTVAWVNAAAGTFSITFADGIARTRPGDPESFRIARTPPGQPGVRKTSPQIAVHVT